MIQSATTPVKVPTALSRATRWPQDNGGMVRTPLLLASLLLSACATPPADESPFGASHQLITVRTLAWGSVDGQLQRWQRGSTQDAWQPVGTPWRVTVGHAGLAWGLGRHAAALHPGPLKREGDGCAPAGVFALGEAFGYEPAPAWLRWPFIQATDHLRCPDDPHSRAYNRLVDAHVVSEDWNSAEVMRRSDELYRLGVFVRHNSDPVVAGCGSCIFLHIWSGPGRGTAGCTAMDAADLAQLLAWLDPGANPRLVQLPEESWSAAQQHWGTPDPR